jgi:hypothetical protein
MKLRCLHCNKRELWHYGKDKSCRSWISPLTPTTYTPMSKMRNVLLNIYDWGALLFGVIIFAILGMLFIGLLRSLFCCC